MSYQDGRYSVQVATIWRLRNWPRAPSHARSARTRNSRITHRSRLPTTGSHEGAPFASAGDHESAGHDEVLSFKSSTGSSTSDCQAIFNIRNYLRQTGRSGMPWKVGNVAPSSATRAPAPGQKRKVMSVCFGAAKRLRQVLFTQPTPADKFATLMMGHVQAKRVVKHSRAQRRPPGLGVQYRL
jgi:hypothetical protein